MSKVTMQRLAEEAGVSRITVWKVLNDRPGVSEELRQLVRRKAEELGYGVPDSSAMLCHCRPEAGQKVCGSLVINYKFITGYMVIQVYVTAEPGDFQQVRRFFYMDAVFM